MGAVLYALQPWPVLPFAKEGKVEIKGQFFNDLGWSVYEELASLIYAESDSDSFFFFFLSS